MLEFRERVFEAVAKVPRGKVTTYKELARAAGRPRAWRAAANALASNPHPVKIPCHRVVRSDGGVGGYKLGVRRKIELLSGEGVNVTRRKVSLSKYLFRF
ncbi:MAG: MGMT family protein [Candidatus Hadarchaeota archaeon]